MDDSSQLPPQGWYPDPAGAIAERYWDGQAWSQVTRPVAQEGPPAQPEPAVHGGPGSYGAGELAVWGWRVLAFIIDGIIWLLPITVIQGIVMGPNLQAMDDWSQEVLALVASGSTATLPPVPVEVMSALMRFAFVLGIVWAVYRTLMVRLAGGTLGQLAIRLRVVRDGDHSMDKLGWGLSLIRAVTAVALFNITFVGLINGLMPLFTAKKQALHDMIARTVVVRKHQ
ncbi:MAG: RDD family protein [Arachnia sp.]